MLDDRLLEILVCPVCKVKVRLENDRLVCGRCGRRYPVRDGIPVMLPEEAEIVTEPPSRTDGEEDSEKPAR